MRVFISWSGLRSRQVAEALSDWISDVIQQAKTWTSADNIGAGARWSREVDEQLSGTDFGIVCLNRENLTAPWVLFEAGALAKKVEEARLVPYLMDDMNPGDLEPPLGQFQALRWDKQGTRQLINSLNEALQNPLSDERVERIFEDLWPRLERELQNVDEPGELPEVKRPPEDMIRETLDIVRGLARQFDAQTTYLPPSLRDLVGNSWRDLVGNIATHQAEEEYLEALRTSEYVPTKPEYLEARRRLAQARRDLAKASKEFREVEEARQEFERTHRESEGASPEEDEQDRGS